MYEVGPMYSLFVSSVVWHYLSIIMSCWLPQGVITGDVTKDNGITAENRLSSDIKDKTKPFHRFRREHGDC